MQDIGGDESVWQARVPNTYGAFLADLCLHERAMERDLEALEIARGGDSPLVKEAEIQTCVNLAADRLALGRLAEARTTIEWVRGQTSSYARFRWMMRMHAVDAELAVAEGDPERARMAADACLLLAEKYGQPKHIVRGKLAAAGALAAVGQIANARRIARAAAQLADEHGLEHLSWRAWDAAGDRDRCSDSVRRIADGLDDPLRREFLRAVAVSPGRKNRSVCENL